MTNIIYNEFIRKFFEGEVNMEEDSFKLALFTDRYTPNANGTSSYYDISSAGMECVDSNDIYSDNPSKGYKKGGTSVTFTEVKSESGDASFSCGNVHWDNVSLSGENSAKYAIIYKELDGTLICCFLFNIPLILDDENLDLSWEDTVTFSIGASSSLAIDSELRKDSGNAVQNKIITERLEKIYSGIEKYGIRLNGEYTSQQADPDDPDYEEKVNPDGDDWATEGNIDTLSKIDDNFIDSCFNE